MQDMGKACLLLLSWLSDKKPNFKPFDDRFCLICVRF